MTFLRNSSSRILSCSILSALFALALGTNAARGQDSNSQMEQMLNHVDRPSAWVKTPVSDEGQTGPSPNMVAPRPAIPAADYNPQGAFGHPSYQAQPAYRPPFGYGSATPPRYGNAPANYQSCPCTLGHYAPSLVGSPRYSPLSAVSNLLTHVPPWAALNTPTMTGFQPDTADAAKPAKPIIPNPFNLSPFQMLHYMWDDTTYTSDANPVSLFEVRNSLQVAQQDAQLAQSAATRARFATNPQEKEQAVQQAQYYADQARTAARQANADAQGGSLNPNEVASAAVNEADLAQQAATSATSNASARVW